MSKSFWLMPLIVFGNLIGAVAQASQYPPDYGGKYTCQEKGPVKVCRSMQYGGSYAVIDIYYNGYLKDSVGLSAHLQFNYQSGPRAGDFKMNYSRGPGSEFTRITGGCVVADQGGCLVRGTDQMRSLLQWAQNQSLGLNALSLDVSFFDQAGQWDSNGTSFGTYHFDFPQQ